MKTCMQKKNEMIKIQPYFKMEFADVNISLIIELYDARYGL